MKVYGEMVE